jgi:hypothetical protein
MFQSASLVSAGEIIEKNNLSSAEIALFQAMDTGKLDAIQASGSNEQAIAWTVLIVLGTVAIGFAAAAAAD